MEGKNYLHAAGVTCPLRVVIALVCDDEATLEIPSFAREFLLSTFAKFVDPVAHAYMHAIKIPKDAEEQLLQRAADSITQGADQEGADQKSFFHQTAHLNSVDSPALVIEVDVSQQSCGMVTALQEAFVAYQKQLFEGTGLLWLRIDSDQLTKEELEQKLDWVITQRQKQLNPNLAKAPWFIKEFPDANKIRGAKEQQIHDWLQMLGLSRKRKDYSLKSRKKDQGIQHHLWIKPEALKRLRLSSLGLRSQSGYQQLDVIFKEVQRAVKESKEEPEIPDCVPGDC